MKKVCVIGLGAVGLPTALLAAKAGLKVIGVDADPVRIARVNDGTFYHNFPEFIDCPGDCGALASLYASTDYEEADYFVITVPISISQDYKTVVSTLSEIATKLCDVLKIGDTVIIESKIPVGVTRSIADVLQHGSGLIAGVDFFVAYCPEQIRKGNTLAHIQVQDRIVGGINHTSAQHAASWYQWFVSGDLYLTDVENAEIACLLEHSFMQVHAAFTNTVSMIAQKYGCNPYAIIELANKNPQVSIQMPGSYEEKHGASSDLALLCASFKKETTLLREADKVNKEYNDHIVTLINDTVALKKKDTVVVLLLGLGSETLPSGVISHTALHIMRELLHNQGITLLICDPYMEQENGLYLIQKHKVSLSHGVAQADIVVALANYPEFKTLDWSLFDDNDLIDCCGLWYWQKQETREQEQFFWSEIKNKKLSSSMSLPFVKTSGKRKSTDTQSL